MSKAQKTQVNNAQLNHLLKLGDTYLINAENGVWQVESGTYRAIKKAVEHTKTEMFKQSRKRRRTMNIEYIVDQERRGIISEANTREV